MDAPQSQSLSTGVQGLDEILFGGLDRRRTYLVEGRPGAGKTTLALQWLMDGVALGERCLHISLSETVDELQASMASHDWAYQDDNLTIVALTVAQANLRQDPQYTMYHPSEVELGETLERLLSEVERVQPQRVVIDSLSEVRLLAEDTLRFRHKIFGLKQYLADLDCTTFLISLEPSERDPAGLHSLVHGVINLRQTIVGFGATRREVQVVKMRGRDHQGGVHDFVIRPGGLDVFAPLNARSGARIERTPLASGQAALDDLLGGGLTRGTSTLFIGPTGSGKSAVTTQYAAAALARGQGAAVFTFDERRELFLDRAAGIGLDLSEYAHAGLLTVEQIDPGQLSPGGFARRIRSAVEEDRRELVAIDSLNGYLSSMPEERFLLIHLHEILSYLAGEGVTSILTCTQPGTFAGDGAASMNASYLSDATVLFRYFEARGEVRKAVSVLKKRLGGHQKSIRELRVDAGGIDVGEPMGGFEDILRGTSLGDRGGSPSTSDDDRG